MRRALADAGFRTTAPYYGMPHIGLAELVRRCETYLPPQGPLHIVGHSLGGLISVRLMATLPRQRRGRVVQLGSPNLGSDVARRAEILKPVIGPILDDLAPQDLTVPVELEVGAIAGSAAPHLLGQVTGLGGPNDGLVTVRSAWAAAGPENRIAFPVLHSFMMLDRRVIHATVKFLQTGRFH